MTESVEVLFDQGIARYKGGEPVSELIPVFKDICDRAPKSAPAFTCLAWLYLLEDKPAAAYKAAQRAVKLNPQDPQAQINLALAILDSGKKGVRDHIEIAAQVLTVSSELREELRLSVEEGLSRKPDWKSLTRVRQWLFES